LARAVRLVVDEGPGAQFAGDDADKLVEPVIGPGGLGGSFGAETAPGGQSRPQGLGTTEVFLHAIG
jgi:hypothetical protein